jgi:hypothetical protein
MEFLLYLTPVGNEILNRLISAKFHIHENSGICKTQKVFGWMQKPNKLFICTDNIKSQGFDPNYYVNETLYHEATHAAQICKNKWSFGFGNGLGIPKYKMPLPLNKKQDIQKSIQATGDPSIANVEHEAFYLEDKPEQVLQHINRFCF